VHFETCFDGYSLEYGAITRLKDQLKKTTLSAVDSDADTTSLDSDDDADDVNNPLNFQDDDDDANLLSDLYAGLNAANEHPYAQYMFKELALRVIMTYQDLIKNLATNTFLASMNKNPALRSAISSSTTMTPKSIGQAIEELEFIKAILREALPSELILQPTNYSSSMPAAVKSGVGVIYPSADQLMKIGQIYSVMILR
jgi:hypothetical protein